MVKHHPVESLGRSARVDFLWALYSFVSFLLLSTASFLIFADVWALSTGPSSRLVAAVQKDVIQPEPC